MLQSFNLDASSSVTNVALTNDSTKLSYTANLHDLTITGVPGGTPALTLDWSQMTTNGLGRPFTEGYVTSAIVGHYTQTPAQLEAQFLDLDRHRDRHVSGGSPSRIGPRFHDPEGRQWAPTFQALTTTEPGWSASPAAIAAIRRPGT